MREGTIQRVMAADRPHGNFYDFCSVSPEYFGNHPVYMHMDIFAAFSLHTPWLLIIAHTMQCCTTDHTQVPTMH
jgi:hypothetical protein